MLLNITFVPLKSGRTDGWTMCSPCSVYVGVCMCAHVPGLTNTDQVLVYIASTHCDTAPRKDWHYRIPSSECFIRTNNHVN